MAIFKFKGSYKAEVFVSGKKVATKYGFKNKSEARLWHDAFKATYDPSKIKDGPKLKMDDLLRQFEATHLKTIKYATAERYRVDIRYRIEPFFRFFDLQKIDIALIERFRADLIEKQKLKPKTINNCTDTLRLILNKGVKWGMLVKNPFDMDRLKVPEQNYEWWERREQVQAFLQVAAKTRYYPLYLTALETGMRLGEIVGLSKGDVSFDRMQIRVHRQWLDKEKRYGPCKANNVRTIPMSEGLADVLKGAIEASPNHEAIFVTRTGRRAGARKVSGEHFPRLIGLAGVPEITFHGLRHTFASHFMINGGSIWDLRQILGHADIKMTQRYAHLSPLNLKAPTVNWASSIDHSTFTQQGSGRS